MNELFPNIALSARLFVYTSDETLSPNELTTFSNELSNFISAWKAHGTHLNSSFLFIANRVLLIVVDEQDQNATGCSIDSLNRYLQKTTYNWFTRNWVLHNSNSNDLNSHWKVTGLQDFHSKCKSGEISLEEYVLNTTVLTLADARKNMVQTVSESWHMQML